MGVEVRVQDALAFVALLARVLRVSVTPETPLLVGWYVDMLWLREKSVERDFLGGRCCGGGSVRGGAGDVAVVVGMVLVLVLVWVLVVLLLLSLLLPLLLIC